MYEKLRNIDGLKRQKIRGIYKHWIYVSMNDFHYVCDCLQKVNYSIQDINGELKNNEFGMKEIVYIISLVDWIKDSYTRILEKIKKEVAQKYVFSKPSELKLAKDYFVAIRSYIVAHPMNTTRHNKFGFDGDFVCVDLTTNDSLLMPLVRENQFFSVDYYGLHNGKNKKHKYYLLSYSNSMDKNKYSKYISFSIDDILNVARLYIDALYELDNLLAKLKRKDY